MSGRHGQGSRIYLADLCKIEVVLPLGFRLDHQYGDDSRQVLVRLVANRTRSLGGGSVGFVVVGSLERPLITIPVGSITHGYRVFLLVRALLAKGRLNAEGQIAVEVIGDPMAKASVVAFVSRWLISAIGRAAFGRIMNLRLDKMPAAIQAEQQRQIERGR